MTDSLMFNGLEIRPDEEKAVGKVVQFIRRFGLVTPAILALESCRPLSVVGAQTMHVLSPMAGILTPFVEWDSLARLLDDRRGLDYVLSRLEASGREHHDPE